MNENARMGDRAAILVLPTSTAGQQGPVAAWMSAAGWASAVERVLGHAWLVTTDGIIDPEEARTRGSLPQLSSGGASGWHRRVPTQVITAIKDVRQWRRARQFTIDPNGPWSDADVAFVWQRHELFHDAGVRLARTLDVPSVLFVPATLIWEAGEWGVRRPGWRSWLERRGESPALRAADLVACGSERVAQEARRLGVDDDRILVTPTGVDLNLFRAGRRQQDPEPLRQKLGLDGRFVVGWIGSFRPFHALDVAIEAVSRVDGLALLLIGDGPERGHVETMARDKGVEVVTTGTVPHGQLTSYFDVMDVALVVASRGQTYHYSPLKLAEYLAAGVPTIAPRVPQISERLHDGVDAILVRPGDVDELASALTRLRDDPTLGDRLSSAARAAAQQWSWDRQVERIVAALR